MHSIQVKFQPGDDCFMLIGNKVAKCEVLSVQVVWTQSSGAAPEVTFDVTVHELGGTPTSQVSNRNSISGEFIFPTKKDLIESL